MSNNNVPEKAKNKKPNFFVRAGRSIATWFREMKSEMKKVVWPSRKQTINNSIVAVVVMLCSGVVLWGFDELAYMVVQALISLGN